MIKIKIIFAGPQNAETPFRRLCDLLPYQSDGVEISLGFNSMGPIHCQSSIEEALACAGMAKAAINAQNEGANAIVIESMGDTGLIQCREATNIPVVGMSDCSFRIAQMLGRKFGVITAGTWHGYALERLIKSYGLCGQYVGFQSLNMQPFFTDATSNDQLENNIISSIMKLIQLHDADTIVLGGSYFLGKSESLARLLTEEGYPNILIIDPLPLSINFARLLVDSKLLQNKAIYACPTHSTAVIGYPEITKTPGT